ncbi:hypothetical protein [Devosia sp. MC521]|uniref:hypothetical protein n=1 Tax=Devosia sp. MC521 TaxID=2759954 RepID=UPI0018F06671|nr:hypothetical protein [Devosia sp. MC521]MBJ6986092.1 hypothetical protein [Devosia sp. MC521]
MLAALTEFGGADDIEAVGAHCLIIEETGGIRVTVQYQRGGGPVRYGTGDAEHNVYVTEADEDHARMWTGPSYHGTMYHSIDEIEYGRNYREIARLAVHDQDVLRKRVAGREAIAALVGQDGYDVPAISNVAWLETLLEVIEDSPEIMKLLEGDDWDSTHEMLKACRQLATEGKKVVRDRFDAANPEPDGDPDELPVVHSYPRSTTPPPEPWVDADGNMPF